MSTDRQPCQESCGCDLNRRQFISTAAAGVAGVAAVAGMGGAASLALGAEKKATGAGPTASSKGETLVAQLYKSLKEEQKKEVCFEFDNPERMEVDNNWFIVDQKKFSIGKFFNKDQQDLVKQIFNSIHSEEYGPKVLAQVEEDNKSLGGLNGCTVAMFGKPGEKFEFVFTGRHVTRRCDGNSVEGTAFGGPIFYGHAAGGMDNEKPDHPGNAYWYQAKSTNKVYQILDEKQRKQALQLDGYKDERGTDTVKLTGKKEGLPGLRMADCGKDQQEEVKKVMKDLLAPFRKEDADEAMSLLESSGFEHLHMAFYKKGDIGGDGVWDVWQIEGPSMLWFFRGAPHVHCWVHIKGAQA